MATFSRRDFLQALAATGFCLPLAGCGGGGGQPNLSSTGVTAGPVAPGSGPFDVAIIGAGMAGLAAAQMLLAGGYRIAVLEARNRIGGRTVVDSTSIPGYNFDIGAQWFHQVPNNVLLPIAQALFPGQTYLDSNQIFKDGTVVDPITGLEVANVLQQFQAQVNATGAALDPQPPSQDVSIAAATAGLNVQKWYQLVTRLATADASKETDKVSVLDLFYSNQRGGDNWLIRAGMGTFVATFAAGVPISLSTPVSTINWSGSNVQLGTPAGVVTARSTIVTIPPAVLNTGLPAFSPALPASYQSGLAGLNNGFLTKIAIQFDSDVFGLPGGLDRNGESTTAIPLVDSAFGPIALAKIHGTNVLLVFLDGDLSRGLEAEGTETLVDFALDTAVNLFGTAVRSRYTGRFTHSSWDSDPFSRGAYSFASPGNVRAREDLVNAAPLNNKIFLAGEAFSKNSHSTVHGAYESGRAAATRVIAAIGAPA